MKTEAAPPPPEETRERFELVPLAGGVNSLRSLANGQTFHPVVGPAAEAEAVHVAGTRLVERANALPAGHCLVIWDVGLGAAANALAAVRALQAGYRHPEEVMLFSFDHSLEALRFAVDQAETLDYPLGFEPALRALLETGGVDIPVGETTIFWRVVCSDFPATLAHPRRFFFAPHAVFFDPYSPAVNPEMWTLETFAALYGRTNAAHPCLLTTYTRSTSVRVALLLAGWGVGIGGATGEKDETTVAANALELLERPLDRQWLEKKVYASTNAAPLRAGTGYTRGPISEEDFEKLRAHPQFG